MDRLSPTKHSATDNLLLYRLAFRRRQRTPSELNLNNRFHLECTSREQSYRRLFVVCNNVVLPERLQNPFTP